MSSIHSNLSILQVISAGQNPRHISDRHKFVLQYLMHRKVLESNKYEILFDYSDRNEVYSRTSKN